jgi:hypothetical protein
VGMCHYRRMFTSALDTVRQFRVEWKGFLLNGMCQE